MGITGRSQAVSCKSGIPANLIRVSTMEHRVFDQTSSVSSEEQTLLLCFFSPQPTVCVIFPVFTWSLAHTAALTPPPTAAGGESNPARCAATPPLLNQLATGPHGVSASVSAAATDRLLHHTTAIMCENKKNRQKKDVSGFR